MSSLFLLAFVAGLVLNVILLIRGTERWSRREVVRRLDAFGRELRLGRISLRTPIAASMAGAFGLTGYLLTRFTALGTLTTVAVAASVAAVAVISAVLTIKQWAVPHALRDAPDERFALQGQLATVSAEIPFGAEGEVAYQIDDRRFTTRARSVDDSPLARGTDVVIDRVEEGVVFVEDWARVEQRL